MTIPSGSWLGVLATNKIGVTTMTTAMNLQTVNNLAVSMASAMNLQTVNNLAVSMASVLGLAVA